MAKARKNKAKTTNKTKRKSTRKATTKKSSQKSKIKSAKKATKKKVIVKVKRLRGQAGVYQSKYEKSQRSLERYKTRLKNIDNKYKDKIRKYAEIPTNSEQTLEMILKEIADLNFMVNKTNFILDELAAGDIRVRKGL